MQDWGLVTRIDAREGVVGVDRRLLGHEVNAASFLPSRGSRESRIMRKFLALSIVAALMGLGVAGCGAGSAAIAGSGGGGSGGGDIDAPAVATNVQVVNGKQSPALIQFDLVDSDGGPAEVDLFFAAPGQAPQPLSNSAAGPVDVVENVGATNSVPWFFDNDGLGPGLIEDVAVLVQVRGGVSAVTPSAIVAGQNALLNVRVGNDAPILAINDLVDSDGNSVLPEFDGTVSINFQVSDTSSIGDLVDVAIEFNTVEPDFPDGSNDSNWQTCLPAGFLGDASSPPAFAFQNIQVPFADPMAPVPPVQEFVFSWDTDRQLGDFDQSVQLRVTVGDKEEVGSAVVATTVGKTNRFRIDNNAAPIAVLQSDFFLGAKDRGVIPIPFRVFDAEGDSLRVVMQWKTESQAAFQTLPNDLADLATNPARIEERRRLQIAREVPHVFTGRVSPLPGMQADQVRLPELNSSAAGLLAQKHGISGRTLEIMRAPGVPKPEAASSANLIAPVASLILGDGRSALVLDAQAGGWGVAEVELETGTIENVVAVGAGEPRAMAMHSSGSSLFVASDVAIYRLNMLSGGPLEEIPHGFTGGPRSIEAIGTDQVVATGDDELVRYAFPIGTRQVLLGSLQEPWGVRLMPSSEGSLIVAEQGRDRLITIDLDSLRLGVVPASVNPQQIVDLGPVGFPAPTNFAFELDGARLLVLCEDSEGSSLRTLNLLDATDSDPPIAGIPLDGFADNFVQEVTDRDYGFPSGVSTGQDQLRVLSSPSTGSLSLAGGVQQRRSIVSSSRAYDPITQVVQLEAPFNPQPEIGAAWRIGAPVRAMGSPEGRGYVFLWDSSDVPDVGGVQVRALPIDSELGTEGSDNAVRSYSSNFIPTETTYSAGTGTEFVELYDLDGDGDLDLLGVTRSSNLLSLHFQTEPGVFGKFTPIVTVGSPTAADFADIDADGDGDLISVGSSDGMIRRFIQAAPGLYADFVASPLPAGSGPNDIIAVDLDGNGLIDLATANAPGGDITLLFQNSSDSFAAPAFDALDGLAFPTSLAAADLNMDGALDLVSSTSGSGDLSIFIQGLPQQFTPLPSGTLMAGGAPQSVDVADLDGDGDVDLVASGGTSNAITIFFQNAPGQFVPSSNGSLPAGDFPGSATVADLDLDGDMDIAVANELSEEISLYYQISKGVFLPSAVDVIRGIGRPGYLAAGDVDGDGDVDLAAAISVNPEGTDGELAIIEQVSRGSLQAAETSLTTGIRPVSVAIADLDSDGDSDLVSADNSGNTLSVFFQASAGVFAPSVNGPIELQASSDPRGVTAADLNQDGKVDLAAAGLDGRLRLYLQTEPGSFEVGPPAPFIGTFVDRIDHADLNQDGKMDLAVADLNFAHVVVFLQGQPGVFDRTTVQVGNFYRSFTVGDINGDGFSDFAISGGGEVRVILQVAAGVFGAPMTFAISNTGDSLVGVTAADLNGDGRTDLIVADEDNDQVILMIQDSLGAFAESSFGRLNVGDRPSAIEVLDVDEDGDLDFVVTNEGSSDLSVYLQSVPGQFVASKDVPNFSGTEPRAMAIGDLDDDGDLDVATANFGSSDVTILFNGD